MIRPLRLLPAVALASVASSLLLCVVVVADGEWDDHRLSMMAVALATDFAMWVIGTGSLALACRHGVRRANFLLLGACLAFLAPPATLFATVIVAPTLSPWLEGEFTRLYFVLTLGTALLNAPFGCLGGWIVWALAFPHEARTDVDDGRFTRDHGSLGTRRLLLSLCLMPLLPAAILAGLLILYALDAYSDIWVREIWWQLIGWAALPALVLAFGGGIGFVTGSSWAGRRISRGGCLALGGGVAFLLPFALALTGTSLGAYVPAVMIVDRELFQLSPVLKNVASLYIFGALLVPFGLPGGWLFWRFGVRPAPQPLPIADPAAVFD